MGKEVDCLLFADDVVLVVKTKETLEERLRVTIDMDSALGLEINQDKSKGIIFQ